MSATKFAVINGETGTIEESGFFTWFSAIAWADSHNEDWAKEHNRHPDDGPFYVEKEKKND